MTDQQALALDVPRVAKRSTSRVVRRPETHPVLTAHRPSQVRWPEPAFAISLMRALDRAGVRPGDSFYVARVPPREHRSHLGDLEGEMGSRAFARREMLDAFRRTGPATAREAGAHYGTPGAWRRVSELVQGGHLEPTGETRENTYGHPARVLRITARGRAALEAST